MRLLGSEQQVLLGVRWASQGPEQTEHRAGARAGTAGGGAAPPEQEHEEGMEDRKWARTPAPQPSQPLPLPLWRGAGNGTSPYPGQRAGR